ncbi:hypothetical protein [Dictyobacter arantiisoli]|uniref:hypothetical protein n=1 Tax=Dictyobacter arantiisoli TaxID=2014874 RepID=UPI0011EC4BE9|nr:hypothetical protein [Dictyobacter arantiisoli]
MALPLAKIFDRLSVMNRQTIPDNQQFARNLGQEGLQPVFAFCTFLLLPLLIFPRLDHNFIMLLRFLDELLLTVLDLTKETNNYNDPNDTKSRALARSSIRGPNLSTKSQGFRPLESSLGSCAIRLRWVDQSLEDGVSLWSLYLNFI